MRAAVGLVGERGTAAVSISDIAEAADVSRQLVYQQFGDRDTLLLEAALDLARRELLPGIAETSAESTARDRTLFMTRHFADHRSFYRAILTSSCGFALNKALTGLLIPFNRQVVRQRCGERFDPQVVEDVAMFLTGGVGAFVNAWVVTGEDPLDPEEFTDRLLRMRSVIAAAIREPATITHDREQHR